jgi:putative protease
MQKKNTNHICNPPEILAPAGDMDSLLGALKGKADAIYLGVGDFNARQGANNFTLDELEEAIDMAHLRSVKVFLALNIPIKQKELQRAIEVVDRAYSYGIDAIILEDIGLMSLITKLYPDLPIHASTQMTIHNKKGVDFIEDAGADRVILSRELTADQVKDIIDKSHIDVELFVHGALCYSYSGRCLFSSFISRRSANRGACIQPCRRSYKIMIDGKEVKNRDIGEFPISCAELCTLPELEKIVEAGVMSLKIEGRMKRPEYVTASSTIYKDAVDKICSTRENFSPDELQKREDELSKLFYRGFTKGFVLEEKDVSHQKYSSNYGIFLGKVQRIIPSNTNTGLDVILHQDITDKDGIAIFTKNKMLGCKIESIKIRDVDVTEASAGDRVILAVSSKTAKPVRNHDEVYLSTDSALIESLRKQKLSTVPLDISVSVKKGKAFAITVKEARGEGSFIDEFIVQDAKKSATTKDQIIGAIEKLGDTPYSIRSIKVDMDENIFVPMGVLTGARRQVVSLLEGEALKAYKREEKKPLIENIDVESTIERDAEISAKKRILSVEVNGPKFLSGAIEAGADIVYLPIEWFKLIADGDFEMTIQDIEGMDAEIVFITPQVSFDAELAQIKELMIQVKNSGFKLACSNFGTIQIAKEIGADYVVQKEMNIFNANTALKFFDQGACRATVSTELNLDEIGDICINSHAKAPEKQIEIVAHGRELLLITENDLLKPFVDKNMLKKKSDVYLIDNKDVRFPVKRSGTRTLIYHSQVLNMLEHINDLMAYDVDVIRLNLSLNSHREVIDITKAYKTAIAGKTVKMKGNNREVPTTGHYFDGVM